MAGTILLYYKYVTIPHPEEFAAWQRTLCTELNLTGRILISSEGINGTVGGETIATNAYRDTMLAHPLFCDVDFKESPGSRDDFPRLSVRVRTEVVSLGIDTTALKAAGPETHLTPDQAHQLLTEQPEDLVVLDARNDYEYRIGRFKGAILPPINRFRDFPAYIDSTLDQLADKTVLMYCTGGIRCERASAYVQSKGVAKKVLQISGGICRYVEKYPDGFFRGKNYVFDDRIALKVNSDVLTTCDLCDIAADTYTNCMNADCNSHFIACTPCRNKYDYTCSVTCHTLVTSGQVKQRPKRVAQHEPAPANHGENVSPAPMGNE